jgi:hypothetical protein
MGTGISTTGDQCTECGWNTPGYQNPPWPWWHYRRYLPLALALIAVAIMMCFPRSYTYSTASLSPQFVLPAFSRAEVRAVSDGSSQAAGLGSAMMERLRQDADLFGGPIRIKVGFVKGEGERSTSFSFGWPASWYSESRVAYYEDAVRQRGHRPAAIDPMLPPGNAFTYSPTPALFPRKEWEFVGFNLQHRPPPETVGNNDVTRWYNFSAMIGTVGVFATAAWIVWLTFDVVARVFRREATRRWRWAATLVLPLALIGWMSVGSLKRHERVGTNLSINQRAPGVNFFTYDVLSRIRLDRADIARLANTPGGDREIATAIIDAASPGDDAEMLIAQGVSTVFVQSGRASSYPGWLGVVRVNEFDFSLSPEEGTVRVVKPSWTRTWKAGIHMFNAAWVAADGSIREMWVNLQSVGVLAFGVAVVATIDWWLFGPIAAWMGRRSRRRGLCPACRYPLTTRANN